MRKDPVRLGGLAMLPAILRKSLALAQKSPANRTIPHKNRRGAPGDRSRGQQCEHCVSSLPRGFDRVALARAQGERADGDTIISLRHWTQRALVPTISQAGSPDTMSRRHFGQVYPATDGGKSYCGPT